MLINYIDTALAEAVELAVTKYDECSLVIAAFSGDVTIKLYGPSSAFPLSVLTCAPFTHSITSTGVLTNGAILAEARTGNAAVTEARYFDGSIERFRCPISISPLVGGCSIDISTFPLFNGNPYKSDGAGSGGGGSGSGALTAADLSVVGRFRVPALIGSRAYQNLAGGFCLKTGGASPQFYIASMPPISGNSFQVGAAVIQAPASVGSPTESSLPALPVATVLQSTDSLLDVSPKTIFNTNADFLSSNGLVIKGLGYDSGSNKLIVSIAPYYGLAPEGDYNGTLFTRSADLSATSTTQGPVKLTGTVTRHVPGPLVKIPAALASAWGAKPWVSGGSSGLSVNETICNGPGMFAFDPADITSVGASISTKVLANYPWASGNSKTFADAMGSGFPAVGFYVNTSYSPFWGWTSHAKAGPCFIEHKNVVAHIGMRATTREFYKGNGDPASYAWTGALPNPVVDPTSESGNAPRGYPYKRCVWVFNESEYAAVASGSKQPHQAQASAVFDLPDHPFRLQSVLNQQLDPGVNTQSYSVVGSAYDPSTKRLYLLHGGSGAVYLNNTDAYIEVLQVAA